MLLTSPRARAARRWRRTRPFWAGLLLVLAGVELVVMPMVPLTVLFGLGPAGIAAVGIGTALVAAGLFLWFLPHTRHYVGVHAVILAVFSFAATNLGGFLVGMLLGIAGGAMGFAWTPAPAPHGTTLPAGPEHPPALAVALPLALLAALGPPALRPPAPGHLTVARTPPTVTTTRFAPDGLTLTTVTDVPTAAGPRRAMVLRMRAATLTDYRLRAHDGDRALTLGAGRLSISGDVTLYLTRLSGCVQGILCTTFTPDTLPVPPVVPPFVFMTHVSADQALVTGDTVTADGLAIGAAQAESGRGGEAGRGDVPRTGR
ncbi:DUF6114 domain-containing protein [Streptomyces sp. NPDC020799]|uniref:DUF6114 domain-containing protein n=1 Tax=Streptomyces sp. NPDC020799 TaxID=3365091 RepID=UPI00378B04BD